MKSTFLIFLLFTLFSCSKDQVASYVKRPLDCDSTSFYFQRNILPIFNSSCNFDECHGSGGLGSYDFTDYSVVANRVRTGSIEYRLGLPLDDPQHMPEHMRLNDCDYFIIKTWIQQGFPEK